MLRVPAQLAEMQGIDGYHDDNRKLTFLREGAAFMRSLAKEIGMATGTYAVRTNKGGPAVSGEVYLHGETLYAWLEESCVGARGIGLTYRTCRGVNDHSGHGQNHRVMLADLFSSPDRKDEFLAECKRLGGFA